MEGSDGAIRLGPPPVGEDTDRYFYPDQYYNAANRRAHYVTTAAEIIEQTEGRVTHFVAGMGTSGTLVGTGRRLKERRPEVDLVASSRNRAPRARGPQAHGVGDCAGHLRVRAWRIATSRVSTEEA